MYYFRYLLNNEDSNSLCSFNKCKKIKLYYASHIALAPLFQYQPNFEMTQNGLIIAQFKVFLFTCICIISDTCSTMKIVTVYVHSINAKK